MGSLAGAAWEFWFLLRLPLLLLDLPFPEEDRWRPRKLLFSLLLLLFCLDSRRREALEAREEASESCLEGIAEE